MISLWFPTIDRWNRFFASRRKIRGNRKTELRPRVYRTRVKFFRADNLWLETSGEKILRKYFLGSITPSVKYSIISPFWKLRITNRFVKMNYYSANQYSAEIKKRKKKSIPKYFETFRRSSTYPAYKFRNFHDNLHSSLDNSIERSIDRSGFVRDSSIFHGPFGQLEVGGWSEFPRRKGRRRWTRRESIIYMIRKYGCNAENWELDGSSIAIYTKGVGEDPFDAGHREIGILEAGKYWR